MADFLDADLHLPRCRSHMNMSGGASVISGGLSLGFGGGGGVGPATPIRGHAEEDDVVEDLPRHSNELLNIVLSGNSSLDTSLLSSYSTTPGASGKKRRKKRIAGAAKSALQRSPMDDF